MELGIFADKGLRKVEDVIILILSNDDEFLLNYAQKMIHNSEARILMIDYLDTIKQNLVFKENIRAIEQTAPNHIALYGREKINTEFLQNKDLLLLSLGAWNYFIENEPEWLESVPSLLILKKP